jgi:tetratricopeptide (TPR) repeat protein
VNQIAQAQVIQLAQEKFGAQDGIGAVDALLHLASHGLLAGHAEIARTNPKTIDWGSVYDAMFSEVFTAPDDVRRLFKATVKLAEPKINWAHLALGELARADWISTTITTNFDLLALEGYARAGIIPVVSDGIESLDRIDPRPEHPQLLQINGSLHSYKLRNAPSELDEVQADPGAITCFRSLFQNSDVFLVVGYQGREPQIMKLLNDAASTFGHKHVFWCLYSSDPARLSEQGKQFLSHSRNSRLLIGQDADRFFFDLSQELGVHAPSVFRQPLDFVRSQTEKIFQPRDDDTHEPIRRQIANLGAELQRLEGCIQVAQDDEPEAIEAAEQAEQPDFSDDPKELADSIVARLAEKHPKSMTKLFAALRAEQNRWFERGRDKGHNFDLEVSVHLARAALAYAADADDHGAGQNDLGSALRTLGERRGNDDLLDQAITAYRAALTEYTQDRVPLNWATTQNNLGNALRALGERRGNEDLLDQAITAYRAALTEYTQDRVPLNWATTQNNLGTALRALGERRGNEDLLDQAITAFRAALTERTQDRVPLNWAATQHNLGVVLRTLGERRGSEDLLDQAITAYRAALTEYTQDRVPLNWAMTQNNLGTALRTLGERRGNEDLLEQAITAYRAALTERTQDRVPLDWAMSFGNQGVAMRLLAELRSDLPLAQQALDQLQAAEATMRQGGHIPNADYYAAQMSLAQALIDRLSATP